MSTKEYHRQYREDNREKRRKWNRDWIKNNCIDHINDDGAEDRKKRGISGRVSAGINAYEALKRDGYPEGYQVLCANCNLKKEQERKRSLRLENTFYAQRCGKGVLPVCQT